MKTVIEMLSLSAACLTSVVGLVYLVVRHRREHFRTRLRRALGDCIALRQIEEQLCKDVAVLEATTPRAALCRVRSKLRAEGKAALSSHATMQKLEKDLAKL